MNEIIIKGARENNLKNIDITLPRNKLIVMTGVSGSGKSSLAFDTICAEGERRYIESLSTYARQFLGGVHKPDVDSIEGLSPSISIDQKKSSNNPRSTVGTTTEIYDYYRLLYARIGKVYCPNHNILIASQSVDEMTEKLLKYPEGTKMIIYAPIVNHQKGSFEKLLSDLLKDGFIKARIDQEDRDLTTEIKLDKNINHQIDVLIDRLVMKEGIRTRLFDSLETGLKLSSGKVIIKFLGGEEFLMSETHACPYCNFSLPKLETRLFSFNSPFGACPNCNGLGVRLKVSKDLVVPDETKSINDNAIITLGKSKDNIYFKKVKGVCEYFNIDMNKPWSKLSKKDKDIILYGTEEKIKIDFHTKSGNKYETNDYFEGVINNLERRFVETTSTWIREWISKFTIQSTCETCGGTRLNQNALAVKINNKTIYDLSSLSIKDEIKFFNNLRLSQTDEEIAHLLINEIKDRLNFLKNVGLEYLNLTRSSNTLSGGELQRIRLATQIGSKLTGILYVLDEPSIGLHQRDNIKLIKSLEEMRDLGNTLIVVEHDEETMMHADLLVDIGPLAGDEGGKVVALGTPQEVIDNKNSLTGDYLSHRKEIKYRKKRRTFKKKLTIKGARENNLKNIDVDIPLGVFTCVTGVSGSGKSSLIMNILSNALKKYVNNSKVEVGKYDKILGLKNIDKVVEITQNPIGRTPRSNPATYTGVFDDIRELFTETKQAKLLGYKKDRFSFNVKGGRCEACHGDGIKRIAMNFLPDVYIPCEVCHGTRYNSETLKVKYKDKTIADILDMRVNKALEFFENHKVIKDKLQVLSDVGLGYIKLGQSAPTLSGGEASRVKLAKELQKKATGKTVFILDEPTTGLHFADIEKLLNIIETIVNNGDTVIVIEHNLDIIKCADYIIDLGPEGGDGGGNIVIVGTPEEVIKEKKSYTGLYLKKYLKDKK